MARILCVLYLDPVTGYPPVYARDSIPALRGYPDGQVLPTPSAIDFIPGHLLGCVSGELGLRRLLEDQGHELIVTSDKEGPDSIFERELPDADVISQPYWPAYLTAERIAKTPKLKLALTAGIGSDHIDLDAARTAGISVAEATYCNSISVAEHTVLQILTLVGMDVSVIAAGRIGQAVLRRLAPSGVRLHYFDTRRLPAELKQKLGLTFHRDARSLANSVDIVSIHAPLHPRTYHLFDAEMINSMRRGSYVVNTARAEIVVRDEIVKALDSGLLAGYAGDVWYPDPPAADRPWRNHAPRGYGAACLGHNPVRAGSLRRRYPRDPRGLLCWPRHPRGVFDRQGWRASRHRGEVLHRRRRSKPGQRRRIVKVSDQCTTR